VRWHASIGSALRGVRIVNSEHCLQENNNAFFSLAH
jgi:hypothetical protein